MIRTAIVAVFLTLYALLLGPRSFFTRSCRAPRICCIGPGVKGLVFILRIVGMRVRVEGQENIPPGVCLFAANHTSNVDAPAIVGAIPRRIAILARKSLFDIPIVRLGVPSGELRSGGPRQSRSRACERQASR